MCHNEDSVTIQNLPLNVEPGEESLEVSRRRISLTRDQRPYSQRGFLPQNGRWGCVRV